MRSTLTAIENDRADQPEDRFGTRPLGDIVLDDFRSLVVPVRGRSYAPPQPLGEVMGGTTAGDVIASYHPGFTVGDRVVGLGGWLLCAIDTGAIFVKGGDISDSAASLYSALPECPV